MAEKLTDEDISSLAEVGVLMCTDMINAAAAYDLISVIGMEDFVEPAQRITHRTTDVWVTIAEEYAEALDELTANGTL